MAKPKSKAELRDAKAKARARIKEARELAKRARAERRSALAAVRQEVKRERAALPGKLRHWREVNAQIMRRAIEGERHAVRAHALELRTGTRGRAGELLAAVEKQLAADLRHLRWLGKQRHATKAKNPARVKAALRAAELRAEADEFVRDELPREWWPAWEKWKHRIKATPRMTRHEAALDYFHSHPEAIVEAADEELERGTRELLAREASERYGMKPKRAARRATKPKAKPKRALQKRLGTARELIDVPF